MSETPFTPPPLESQYYYVHPSNIPTGRLDEMKRQIAKEGAYAGEIAAYSGLTGAVEVIEPTRSSGLLKIMPNVIDLPANHPVRRGSAESVRRTTSYVSQPLHQRRVERPAIVERQRMSDASPEEVQAVGSKAESLVRAQGKTWEYSPHIRSYKAPGIPRSLVPEAAQESLGFGDEQIDCEVINDSRDGKTTVAFRQISTPDGYPGYFKDSIRYDLSGNGSRVVEATFMNAQIPLETPNPNHPSGSAPIEQPEAQQLAQLLSGFESTK